jgi:hypothetical protein
MSFKNILITLVISLPTLAQATPIETGVADRIEDDRASNIEITATGTLRCKNEDHTQGVICELEFIRKGSQSSIELIAPYSLTSAHCIDHKDMEVELTGDFRQGGFLGSDQLIAKQVTIIRKLENNIQPAADIKQKDLGTHFILGPKSFHGINI